MLLLNKGHMRLMALVPLLLLISACSSKDLSRGKAETLLNEALKESFTRECSLNPLLSKKPEFVALKEERFYEKKVVVTGIRKTSETEAVAEYKIVTNANPAPLKKWLEAMEKLEGRLTTLRAKKSFSWAHLGDFWDFRDPADGQTFIGLAGSRQPENIKDTPEWKKLQDLKRLVSALSEKKQLESKTLESVFRLYDDGWRVVKKTE